MGHVIGVNKFAISLTWGSIGTTIIDKLLMNPGYFGYWGFGLLLGRPLLIWWCQFTPLKLAKLCCFKFLV